jgi:hypothetical protein
MTSHIRQGLLHDAENGRIPLTVRPELVEAQIKLATTATPLDEFLRLPFKGSFEPKVIENGRPELGGNVSRRIDNAIDQAHHLSRPKGSQVLWQSATQPLKINLEARQHLPELIVQFPGQRCSFKLADLDQTRRQIPKTLVGVSQFVLVALQFRNVSMKSDEPGRLSVGIGYHRRAYISPEESTVLSTPER